MRSNAFARPNSTTRLLSRGGAAVAALLLAASGATLIGAGAASAAPGGPSCVPGSVYVNVGDAPFALEAYSPAGKQLSSVPLAESYGDIAFSTNGAVLYGANWNVRELDAITPATGKVIRTVSITGLPDQPNALSSLPDGRLLAGVWGSSTLYTIDPATGAGAPFRASLPAGYTSAGDFVSVQGGDIVSVADGPNNEDYLVRIHPDDTTTVIGSVPLSYGAAQSGGSVYLAGAAGDIVRVDELPTSASTAPLPTTTIAATGQALYGAAAPQDAGLCAPTLPTNQPDSATAGTPFTFSAAASGIPAPTYAVSAGTLPAGLALDTATGVISGTPTTAGTSTVTITATNTVGSDSTTYTFTVAAAPTAPTITTKTLAAATTGTAYRQQIQTTGTGPFRFTILRGALPTGLTLDADTGTISGNPTSSGTTTVTIQASNSAGTTSANYTITTTKPSSGQPSTQQTATSAVTIAPTAAATDRQSTKSGSLAFTGTNGTELALLTSGAAALVLAGGALIITTRRRRAR